MAWTLFVAGGCLYIGNETAKLGLVALFVYLFTIAYSVGEGPVPFMYSAEGEFHFFPLEIRYVSCPALFLSLSHIQSFVPHSLPRPIVSSSHSLSQPIVYHYSRPWTGR